MKQYRYQNNLLVAYRKAMSLFLFAFFPVGLLTALTVFACLHRYQQHTGKAYVFHTGGASIEIYEPEGSQQQEGRTLRTEARQRQVLNARQTAIPHP